MRPDARPIKPIAEAHPDVTFINVEPYLLEYTDGQLQPVLDANEQLQAAPATDEWGLLSEPWIFVVDGDGIVRGLVRGRRRRGGAGARAGRGRGLTVRPRGRYSASSRRNATRAPPSVRYQTRIG